MTPITHAASLLLVSPLLMASPLLTVGTSAAALEQPSGAYFAPPKPLVGAEAVKADTSFDPSAYFISKASAPSLSNLAKSLIPSVVTLPDWWGGSVQHLNTYLTKEDGWKGLDSKAPDQQAVKDAGDLLYQIASEIRGSRQPTISANDDGSICLHWRGLDLITTISVYGDGTYSFYAKKGTLQASADDDAIGWPLSDRLIEILTPDNKTA